MIGLKKKASLRGRTSRSGTGAPARAKVRTKISGPLLDRLDIHVEVPAVQYQDLAQEAGGDSSEAIKKRVDAAKLVQQERFRRSKIHCNAQMPPRLLRRFCPLGPDSQRLLEAAIDKIALSARASNRLLAAGEIVHMSWTSPISHTFSLR